MPSDDHPLAALNHQLEMEDSSRSPVAKVVVEVLSRLPLKWPIDKVIAALKDQVGAGSRKRLEIFLEVFTSELIKNGSAIRSLEERCDANKSGSGSDTAGDLLEDAARKAANTRALERVRRIGLILAHGILVSKPTEADEVEEMMRVAMELGDIDVRYLRELVRIEGEQVAGQGRINNYLAHSVWEAGFWKGTTNSEIDSVFSKLESFGLVTRLPPPNNLNLMADFQHRYALLQKGLRFVELIQQKAATSETQNP